MLGFGKRDHTEEPDTGPVEITGKSAGPADLQPVKESQEKDTDQETMMSSAPHFDSTVDTEKSAGGRQLALIGSSIQLNGDLHGEEDLRVEGEFKGTITLKNSALTVGSQGKVKANVYAKTICVEGYMEGDMFASERVIIRRSAQVLGNITSPRVSLEDGAKLKGSVEMDPEALQGVFKGKAESQPVTKPASTQQDSKPAEPKQAEAKAGDQKPAQSANETSKSVGGAA